ncbi:MAG: GIY-YIG nuclease family protein [Gammaproteobacteria bacterium]|jgi:putative endonuclease|nr:GIY-YIG nuclease family protein [Gammaproteobacteria bacterium]MBT3724676.1 GIY-YIG nuclease family protein [Gammaproteobacteria bacterium]MBT4077049.1 GIY-YIG nuclease family protein [Gammaproteobacteria bacterium]MBT4193342.1 GIY-YIG nuclease family protein [Gammaproteobacteria bacterium]MBT4449162.1 GIY-YIG nuclease family protein [Gammaproteobacteria bacterium]
MSWNVYILRCSDNSLYTGITTDVERRISEHNDKSSNLGAKFTRGRQPVKLVFQEQAETRSQASKREMEIKSLTRIQKLNLIESVIK